MTSNDLWSLQPFDAIRPGPDEAPHPFKGKTVAEIEPVGSWWHKGWLIRFTDGTWFSTHPV